MWGWGHAVGILETPGVEDVNYLMLLLYLTLMHFLSTEVSHHTPSGT